MRTISGIAVFLLTALMLTAVCGETVLDFSSGISSDAASDWKPSHGAPLAAAVRDVCGGVRFECPFSAAVDRFYWDKNVNIQLLEPEVFELELSCEYPENIRHLSFYLRSGNGWYAGAKCLTRAGRQILIFKKSDFKVEGNPAGWKRIDGVRISPWKAKPLPSNICLYRLSAYIPQVLIARDDSDALPKNCAATVGEWLTEIDVPYRTILATELSSKILTGRALVILPYNPRLTAPQIKTLKTFIRGGGKLFIFCSGNATLAGAMGLRVGRYIQISQYTPWTRMVFEPGAGLPFPEVLYHNTAAVTPVYPAAKSSKILARWSGKNTGVDDPPALLMSHSGFWMTHIPRRFHAQANREMMAAAVAFAVPDMAPRIVRAMLRYAGEVGSFQTLPAVSLSLREESVQKPHAAEIVTELNLTDMAYRDTLLALTEGRHLAALRSCLAAREHVTRAYALSQGGKNGEFRGVWDHQGTGFRAGAWDETCRILSDSGINAIFPNMLNDGCAHYNSAVLSPSGTMLKFGDQIEQCVKAARKHGIAVHIWKVCWKLDGAPKKFIEKLKKQGRLQMRADGEFLPWLNPAHPANRDMALENLKELVRKYDIDGVHLDYIRYSGAAVCCSPYTQRSFERWLGSAANPWPAAVLRGGRLRSRYNAWRREQISAFVKTVHFELKKIRPDIKISAAVFGSYPDCAESVAQDWGKWMEDKLIDFVCPMNYTEENSRFRRLVAKQRNMPFNAAVLYPGIGVSAANSSLTPSRVIEQILIARRSGCGGFVLFDLDSELRDVLLPLLKPGVLDEVPADEE